MLSRFDIVSEDFYTVGESGYQKKRDWVRWVSNLEEGYGTMQKIR